MRRPCSYVNEEVFLDKSRYLIFAVLMTAFLCASSASAQTAARVVPVNGNGQLTCQGCFTAGINVIPFQFFFPIVVQVVDANGNPIPNKEVDWNLVSTMGPLPFFLSQTFTDGNGYAATNFSQA